MEKLAEKCAEFLLDKDICFLRHTLHFVRGNCSKQGEIMVVRNSRVCLHSEMYVHLPRNGWVCVPIYFWPPLFHANYANQRHGILHFSLWFVRFLWYSNVRQNCFHFSLTFGSEIGQMIHLTNTIKFLKNNFFVLNKSVAWWRYFITKTGMLCQNAFLFKFVFSLGNKEIIGKISLTIEATNSILGLVVKWCHHGNGLLHLIVPLLKSL